MICHCAPPFDMCTDGKHSHSTTALHVPKKYSCSGQTSICYTDCNRAGARLEQESWQPNNEAFRCTGVRTATGLVVGLEGDWQGTVNGGPFLHLLLLVDCLERAKVTHDSNK